MRGLLWHCEFMCGAAGMDGQVWVRSVLAMIGKAGVVMQARDRLVVAMLVMAGKAWTVKAVSGEEGTAGMENAK